MSASRYDVLVVGGGVAGLACAALLRDRLRGRREAVRIGVVEARAPRTPAAGTGPGLRVFAIAPAAEAVLRECGAWQALPPGMAAPYERMRVWQSAGTPFGPGSLGFDAAESGAASLGHIVDHDWLRVALWGRLEAGAVVDLITGVLPQALRPGPDAMVLALADGGTLEARLLVGADGADSWVRGQLGLETTGRSYGQLAIVGHVASEKPHAGTAWQCFLPTGPVALLPLADGRSSFVWSSAEDEARALAALPDDEFAARITAATGRVLGALAMTTPRQVFPLAVRHTHRYTGPRFALVGDAAHQIHPLAGQGINLGLQDVAALAGTVADHLLGTRLADPGDAVVLRRYERGRKGSNLLTMAAMEGLHRVFTSDSAALARLAAAGLGAVDRLPLLKRVLVDQATGGDPGRGAVQGYKIWVFALALFLIGGGIFLYKWRGLGYPVLPEEETRIWTVEATLSFDAGQRAMPVKATLHIPGLTPGFAVLDENFVSRGFGFTTRLVAGGRQVQWAIRRAEGPQTLYYRAVVYKDPAQAENDTVPPFPARPVLGEPLDTAVQELVTQVGEQSADPASFTVELLKRLADANRDQNVALLLAGQADPTARARAAVTVLAAAQVPARLMRGVILVDRERESRIVPWLEVHDGDRWLYFDPATGAQGLPENFLTWWRGDDPLFTLDGGRRMEVTFSVQRTEADPVMVAERRAQTVQSRVADFSLFSLPIQSQAVYAVLLMIPLGALVVVILRNVVGITTFGTFMPVLVALAFRETQVLAGVILFSLVVALGLLFRFVMENFRLLLVPRLASVLIIVVMLMALISIVFHQLGLDMGLSVGLFPMVILTMTIERMSIVWEERGPSEAIQQGVGSLVVAAICYTVMEVEVLKHIFFVFPELLLWVLAICLLLGRYSGYRLLELVRFKSLAAPPP